MEIEQTESKLQNKTLWILIGGCMIVLLCAICVTIAAVLIFFFGLLDNSDFTSFLTPTATAISVLSEESTPSRVTPGEGKGNDPTIELTTPLPPTSTPTPLPPLAISPPNEIDQRSVAEQAFDNLDNLFNTNYPSMDYYESAIRLGGKNLGPRTISSPSYELNDRQTFRTDEERIEAILMAITDHMYFWVEEGVGLDKTEISEVADRMANNYYPRLIHLFGQEWQPGVDNDPHFSILHLAGSASSEELGFFTNIDEYPRSLYFDSNEQEIIYLNMSQLEFGSDLYYGTLVHEIQHLIQWNVDPNESTWLNEGLSQLAEIYLDFDTVDTYEYLQQPEIRLNSWDYDEEKIDAHYAAAYLFAVYLWEQLGETAVQELSRHPANGMASIHSILRGHQPDWSLEQFTADWVAANFLDDPAAGPRYYYRNLDIGHPTFEMRIKDPSLDVVEELNQFGTHFIDLDLRGPTIITFVGDTMVELFDSSPREEETMWFVPGIDEIHATLTAEFDLRDLSEATLKFNTWYDLEEDYDFAYITISTDGGDSWGLLIANHSTAGEFGPAFNGRSLDERDATNGWLKESISLNNYVGEQVLLRFEVLTDFETDQQGRGNGFAIDGISIPELNYQMGVDEAMDVWKANGFVQTSLELPQKWIVQLIEGGPTPRVSRFTLNDLNQGQWAIEIGKGGGVLAITPITPYTDGKAAYWLKIEN